MRLVLPLLLASLLTASLAACSTVSLNPAPVVSQNFTPVGSVAAPSSSTAPASSASAAANAGPYAAYAGQPGYYTVQPGDTVRRIGLQFGQDWHNIVSWNNLSDPNVITVGQVLRVAPPVAGTPPAVAVLPAPQGAMPANGQVAQSYPLAPMTASTPAPPAVAPVAPPAVAATPGAMPGASPAGTVAAPAATASASAIIGAVAPKAVADNGGLQWSWPASGKIIQGYNGGTSKGIDIAGRLGEPIFAAAKGKVVYAGNELRGFGNLVIVKHNADYISVYAHNEKLLVKDGQDIHRGQPVALMGSTDAPRVELHFEVRLRGKPIDPMQVLPPH